MLRPWRHPPCQGVWTWHPRLWDAATCGGGASVLTVPYPLSSGTLSPGGATLPFHVWTCFANSECFQMAKVREGCKKNRSSVLLSLLNHFWLWFDSLEVLGPLFLQFFPFSVDCGLGIRNRHRDLVWQSDTYPFSDMWSMCACGFSSVSAFFPDAHSFRCPRAFECRDCVGFAFILGNTQH